MIHSAHPFPCNNWRDSKGIFMKYHSLFLTFLKLPLLIQNLKLRHSQLKPSMNNYMHLAVLCG